MLLYSDERIAFSTRYFRLFSRDQWNVIILCASQKSLIQRLPKSRIHCTAARYDLL